MERKETTDFEVNNYRFTAHVESYLEFHCPQCREAVMAERLEGGFNVTCDNCETIIRCHFKLVMEWD